MYEAPKAGETRSPKHSHYVSLSNGHTYPAMRNLPGYEDDNLADWRPASAAEIDRYKAGNAKPLHDPVGTVQLAAPLPTVATPSTLQLAPDDPIVDAPDGQPEQDPPPLPLNALPPSPLPAFKVD